EPTWAFEQERCRPRFGVPKNHNSHTAERFNKSLKKTCAHRLAQLCCGKMAQFRLCRIGTLGSKTRHSRTPPKLNTVLVVNFRWERRLLHAGKLSQASLRRISPTSESASWHGAQRSCCS